jgi:hypothetical protein
LYPHDLARLDQIAKRPTNRVVIGIQLEFRARDRLAALKALQNLIS